MWNLSLTDPVPKKPFVPPSFPLVLIRSVTTAAYTTAAALSDLFIKKQQEIINHICKFGKEEKNKEGY